MRIAIIEDNKKFRECLETSLNSFSDCKVIHVLPNALNVDSSFLIEEPDVAIIDINMPGIDGITCVKNISINFPNVQSVMLTVNVDIDSVLKCMQFGAKGYLVKDKDSITKIVDSLRTLESGNYHSEFPLNGTIANKILQHFAGKQKKLEEKIDSYNLTKRQSEILQLLYEGKSYKEIANLCFVSIETINSHVKAIYPKLKITGKGQIRSVLER